jgi:hypothetical protein
MRELSNAALRLEHIPDEAAGWRKIGAFALTFDGYAAWGSFEACAAIAQERRGETLTELRTCLFFEQRRWRHFGEDPDAATMAYLHAVIAKIRAHVRAGTLE